MPLFGPKTKSPQDLVKSLKESLGQLAKEKGEKEAKKVTVFVNGPCLMGLGRNSMKLFTGPVRNITGPS